MCNSHTSLANEPQVGFLANVLVATSNQQASNTHERWVVIEVAEDLSWVKIQNDGRTATVERPWFATAWERFGGPAVYKNDDGFGCTFTRVPEPGDFAHFRDSDGRATTLRVEYVEGAGDQVVMTGGEIAILREWGTYVWHGCRGVDFIPGGTR